ncbi:unnamed protein product, partial [Prorocentrum cordatum]
MALNNTQPLPTSISDPRAPRHELVQLLWKAGVSEDVILRYTGARSEGGLGCTAVSDFAGLYTETTYEDKVEAEVIKIEAHKDDHLEVARVRVSWTLARSELQRALRQRTEGAGPDGREDWDTPLTTPEEEQRANDFGKAYDNLVFESESQPLKTLIGRQWREFVSSTRAVTTLRLERMRTEADLQGVRQKAPKKTPIGGGYHITKDEEKEARLPEIKIQSVLQFLKCLKVLTHLWALCGAALVDSKEDVDKATHQPKKVRQCHLEVCVRYYDFVLLKLLDHPGTLHEKVLWAYDRDRTTRNKARTLYQQGWPWGEALVASFTNHCALEWKVTGVGISSGAPNLIKPEDDSDDDMGAPPKRLAAPKKGAQALKHKKTTSQKVQKATKRTAKACANYNSARGCAKNPKQCPRKKLHVCSNCGLFGHPAFKWRRPDPGAKATQPLRGSELAQPSRALRHQRVLGASRAALRSQDCAASERLEGLDVDSLLRRVAAADCDIVFLICSSSGCACTGSSSDLKSVGGDTVRFLTDFVQLRDRMSSAARQDQSGQFAWLYEDSAGVGESYRTQLSNILGCEPVLLNAAVVPAGVAAKGLTVLRYTGPPIPRNWEAWDGATWAFRNEVGRRSTTPPGTGYAPTYADGRFLPFTAMRPHAADRPPQVHVEDKHVYQRFLANGRMQPLHAHVRGNMMQYSDGQLRPLMAAEREVLMGYPHEYSRQMLPADGSGLDVEMTRRSAVGTASHVPSIAMLLGLLLFPAGCPAQRMRPSCPSRAYCLQWQERHRAGAVWDSEWAPPEGQVQSGERILERALLLFPSAYFRAVSEEVREAMANVDCIRYDLFADYPDYALRQGAPPGALGPDLQALWAKSPMHASVEHQHRPTMASAAAPNLLDWGIGPEEHEARAVLLDHPFSRDPPVESDLQFVVDAYVANGPRVSRVRRRRLEVLQRTAAALHKLDEFSLRLRHTYLDSAPGVRPVYCAFLVVLTGWPDVGLPAGLAQGFELAGEVPASTVLRPIQPKPVGKGPLAGEEEQLLGESAWHCVNSVEAQTIPSKQAPTIYDLTQDEIKVGIADPLLDRAAMDRRFGVGGWRPLIRHCLWQSGKWRPIDDGKRSRTNALSSIAETVVCIPPEFVLILLRALAVAFASRTGGVPAWFVPVVSTEDWWKGFRQLFPTQEHAGLAVVAVMEPSTRKWKYSCLRGLPFGLGVAVNQFSRMAAFVTAMNKRLLLLLTGHYVDDGPTSEMDCMVGAPGAGDSVVCQHAASMGIRYSDSKRQPPSFMFAFLGHLHDLCRTAWSMAAAWGPKLLSRERLVEMCEGAIRTQRLSSGQAAKLRGFASWMDSSLAGRCMRGAMHAFIARQYWDGDERVQPGSVLHEALMYVAAAAVHMPDRIAALQRPTVPPLVLYTDASADGERVRLGAKLLVPGGAVCVTIWGATPEARESWGEQATVINQAELHCGVLVAGTFPDLLHGCDVLWWIDNTAAATAMVKAGSPTVTMGKLALQAHAMLTSLGCRVWIEHVPSKDNPADVLSREG